MVSDEMTDKDAELGGVQPDRISSWAETLVRLSSKHVRFKNNDLTDFS